MKLKPLLYASLVLLMPLAVEAGVISYVTGTPGDNMLATPSLPSPYFHNGLITFADYGYTPSGTAFNPTDSDLLGISIASPDGLTVYSGGTQTPTPANFLYDDGTDGGFDGAANITISLPNGVNAIGVGINDSDDLCTVDPTTDCGTSPTFIPTPVPIEIEVLGLGGADLGSETVTISETTVNPGNGYFVVQDTTPDIYGLFIGAPTTDEGGLGITDIQTTPEPSSFLLLIGGAALMVMAGSYRLRKKA